MGCNGSNLLVIMCRANGVDSYFYYFVRAHMNKDFVLSALFQVLIKWRHFTSASLQCGF